MLIAYVMFSRTATSTPISHKTMLIKQTLVLHYFYTSLKCGDGWYCKQ